MMIKGLIFDMDGLLVDSEPAHLKAWQQALAEYDIKLDTQGFTRFIGTSDEYVADEHIVKYGLDLSTKQLVDKKDKFFLDNIEDIGLLPGVIYVLKNSSGKFSIALASSSSKNVVDTILKKKALSLYFDVIIGGDMVKKKKPEPDIYIKACKELGLDSNQCIAFEDSLSGVTAAKSAGIKVVAVPNKYTREQHISSCDAILESLEQVNEDLIIRLGDK